MLKKLGLSLAALLLALLAAELLVRLVSAAPQIYVIRKGRFQLSRNPKIGYEPVPLAYSGQELSFYDYRGASNSLGYRDREHSIEKPPGVFRIVVLGDSIAAGLRVDRYEDVFPAILERLLRERGLRAEVINFAVSGYNTQQEVETLEAKGLRYQPDLVLLEYSLSSRERFDGDIMKTLLEEERQKQGVDSVRVDPLLVRSALYRFVKFRVLAPRQPPAAAAQATAQYLDLVSTDAVAEYFGELRQLGKDHHFSVVVAIFPRFVHDFGSYRFLGDHQFARSLAEKNGFTVVDLLAPFGRCRAASSEPISTDAFHPNANGHRCAAEALAPVVLAQAHR
ncbi:MAG TPA: SGNH/GDSL hydrolase family protein [Thermoanaerobaculia bacterium]